MTDFGGGKGVYLVVKVRDRSGAELLLMGNGVDRELAGNLLRKRERRLGGTLRVPLAVDAVTVERVRMD
jgi:hypothetical protein